VGGLEVKVMRVRKDVVIRVANGALYLSEEQARDVAEQLSAIFGGSDDAGFPNNAMEETLWQEQGKLVYERSA